MFPHLKFGTHEPSGDNFLFNVHLKLPSLTLVIIVTRRVYKGGDFHSGLGTILAPQEFLLKFNKQDNNNNYFCDSR